MIRFSCFALLVAVVAMLNAASAFAELPVAPAPREVRPDGSRDPAPKSESPAKAEDPAVVVERIIKNSKEVGDKLAMTDTGNDTRKTQDKILSDIDSLINRQENPPPPNPDQNPDKKNNDMMNQDMMNMPPPPKDGMPKDKMGMGMGMNMQQPMGGMNDPPPMGNERRPRNDPMGGKKEPDNSQAKDDPMNKKGGQPKEPKDNKNPAGATAGNPGGKGVGTPALPFDEDVAKDVWGHLPPKLRQQMSQFYKEDVMPRYTELLKLYYSSLSDKAPANPMMPKK